MPQNKVSLGSRIENAISAKLDDAFVQSFVGNLFKGGGVAEAKKHTGIIGALMDIADTKMGYAFGEQVGSKTTELIKMFGTERIGAMMDAAAGRPVQSVQSQEQVSPEEQQKRVEGMIMSLDSTNIEDMNKFMQMTNIQNLHEAERILLLEQDKILQKRGLSKKISPPEVPVSEQRTERRPKNRPTDMNRSLVDVYDNPDSYSGQQFNQSLNTPSNDFFGSQSMTSMPPSSSPLGIEQTQEEIILSLNPDDPTAIHQYMSMRGIAGVDASVVKKMLMKEQKALLENPNSSHIQDAQITQSLQNIPQHTGISPDEDQATLKGGTNENPFLVESKPNINKPVISEPIKEEPVKSEPVTQVQEQEDSMATIMRVLGKIDKKMESLESEIELLKKSSQIKADDMTDILASEEQYVSSIQPKVINVDTIIKESPENLVLNEIITEDILKENKENEDSSVLNDDNKVEDSIQKDGNNESSKQDSSLPKEINWWDERKNIKNEVTGNESTERKNRKLVIKRK